MKHSEPTLLASVSLGVIAICLSDPTHGAGKREFANPPLLEARSSERDAHDEREHVFDLAIEYTDNSLYDPASDTRVPVYLRSYTGLNIGPGQPLVAPTIEVMPGDTVRLNLDNRLPADPTCLDHGHAPNKPHCFNGTNLHTHGLWINPAGNSDNVLLSINPGVKFEYEYNIPADHPAGTFWYHTHRHGSTAMQVASGMAGALIVRGDRPPTLNRNGDLDTLLKPIAGQPFTERLLVLQQIPYACGDREHGLPEGALQWQCKPGQVGLVESYEQFGAGAWNASGRFTSINGEVQPTFTNARAGQVERWRVIHAGVRDTINLSVYKMTDGPGIGAKGKAAVAALAERCTGEPVPFHVVADDGLTLAKARLQKHSVLQTGYRNDLLMVFPEAGTYCVVDEEFAATGSINLEANDRQVLGVVEVGEGTPVGDIARHLTEQLVLAAQSAYSEPMRAQVIEDLRDNLKLTRFTPHKDIAADERVAEKQKLVFFIDNSVSPPSFEVGNTLDDVKPYDPAVIDRTLVLGQAQQWELQSGLANHPFHIHVNPFQIDRIMSPDNVDLSAPGARDSDGDDQYAGLKGTWKDTLMIKGPAQAGGGRYTVYVSTRYQRYIGDFVLHCHILDHEDQGMMENVRIVVPDGAPAKHH
ncbi:multicopper oxidase family protein [Pseudomonas putida]|uniref:multicopper oxidase family protein n=1 Tax=Pseudomonas putida TaxID=303 RepID=UPI003839E6DB